MKAFLRLRRNFEHGVHPAHHKQQTQDLPIQRVPFGSQVGGCVGGGLKIEAGPGASHGTEYGKE